MITDLFLKMSEYLSATEVSQALEDKELSPIAHQALYEEQYLREEKEIAYNRPAIFYELVDSEVLQEYPFQKEKLKFRLHLESPNFASTAMNSHNQAIALKPLRLLEAVKELIKDFHVQKKYSKVELLNYELDTKGGNHPVHVLSYQTTYTDVKCG